MKKSLEIKPLRRYSTPKYPAYTDPNPLDHPESVPFPFSQRLLQWAMATGLVGMTACQNHAQESPVVIANTFTFGKTGLPYMPAIFGTGLPDRLTSKEIREVVLRSCREEGLNIEENIIWQVSANNSIGFPVDIFDKSKKIGFAILDYDNTDNSVISRGFYRSHRYRLINYNFLSTEWTSFAYGGIPQGGMHGWLNMDKQASWSQEERTFFSMFTKATFSELSEDEQEALSWLFYPMFIKNSFGGENQPVLYHKEAIYKAIADRDSKALETALDTRAFIEAVHNVIAPEKWSKNARDRYIDAYQVHLNNSNIDTTSYLLEALLGLPREIDYSRDNDVKNVKEKITAIFQSYRPDWPQALTDAWRNYEHTRFHLDEVKQLDQLAEDKTVFVAPVSFQDRRITYYYTEEELKKEPESPDKSDYQKEMEAMTKEAALKKLEEDLRMYIRWATYQGRY